ncbi:hypothetical protein EW026_g3604 [Hermanssonia centrifuga]|uniref:Inner centromere protein ARK-binding domain-containing protein n=1 Tax=Hermanssonia centrifuga TaxID=98765 RepID=A0A4V3XAL1_9APHY|nr:hypothetical protein EW026_g3604 [Hermanssonia centrifuga]
MDGTGPGEAGVLQWANSIRFSMANDPAREVLAIQIQKGFDFLDSYLESVLSGPKEEYWIFMKHIKRDAPKKTRAASAAASRAKEVTNVPREENAVSVNAFQMALLQAKDNDDTISNRIPLIAPGPNFEEQLSMIVEDNETNTAPTSNLDDHMDQDITVPLRDGPSNNTLKRKPSVSQFSGLPAPSPLRKSMRMSKEPSVGGGLLVAPSLAHTPGAGLGGKRTSWLSKAKEVKARELTGSGKRRDDGEGSSGGLDLTANSTSSGRERNKRKSEDMLSMTGDIAKRLEDERKIKAAKLTDAIESPPTIGNHQSSLPRPPSPFQFDSEPSPAAEDFTVPISDPASQEDVLDRLKKTVEDLGSRTGRSLSKSLGGNAAAALAEARAAAEARVAQRNKQEGAEVVVEPSSSTDVVLEPTEASSKPAGEPLTVTASRSSGSLAGDTSISTTPPNSPPPAFTQIQPIPPVQTQPTPVFSRPPPVFSAPPPKIAATAQLEPALNREFAFKPPATNPFSLPPATTLGIHSSFPTLKPPSPKAPPALSAQSSKASIFSDGIFDKEDNIPAWMPFTQDTTNTEFSTRPSSFNKEDEDEDMDEDDSWHVDDKFKSDQTWTPFGFGNANTDGDDTMTWSTLPSRSTSQKGGDTGPVVPTETSADALQGAAPEQADNEGIDVQVNEVPMSDDLNSDFDKAVEINEVDLGMEVNLNDDQDGEDDNGELDAIVASGKSTITLVQQNPAPRSQSQQSMASTSSSQSQQSQLGFFGQASRLVNSVLGGSKKGKEPVKSLARAAAAAKKQQEEVEKKATRLKEMEQRRQQALHRKTEEEKARALEEERKFKEETERRKREREEHTDKRPLKITKKAEDDTTKKRLPTAEAEKKADTKKPPSKDGQSSRLTKQPSFAASSKTAGPSKSLLKQPSVSSLASAAVAGSSMSKVPISESKSILKTAMSSSNLKAKGKAPETDDAQPAQLLQSQMAHRAKAQIAASTPRQPPPVTSESIELPDINSEYSDSDDEDRPRSFNPPNWAQSPELRQALEQQSSLNPDDIFGSRVPQLRMEEIFRTRQSRFRARTSSANWAGPDQLTAQEEREYERRMGYK